MRKNPFVGILMLFLKKKKKKCYKKKTTKKPMLGQNFADHTTFTLGKIQDSPQRLWAPSPCRLKWRPYTVCVNRGFKALAWLRGSAGSLELSLFELYVMRYNTLFNLAGLYASKQPSNSFAYRWGTKNKKGKRLNALFLFFLNLYSPLFFIWQGGETCEFE